jgi:hypothetical protein
VNESFGQLSQDWRGQATQLASWAMQHLVNRTDVWGRYLPLKSRKSDSGGANHAITAPFRDERGKVFIDTSSLEKYFRTSAPGGQLGLHSMGSDRTSRWFAIDIDLHDEHDLSVSAEGNFVAALGWYEHLQKLGLDPLFMDSNGAGGFHLLVLFSEPLASSSVHQFATNRVADFSRRGLDDAPGVFPGQGRSHRYGNWLRIPGRHHTRDYHTRVWNDEPWDDNKWLEGFDAIQRILNVRPAVPSPLQALEVTTRQRTVCIDFDRVIHSYRSGWQGHEVIADPPIHRSKEAIAVLRKTYRVVVHSARCNTLEGRMAIQHWLDRYGIEVDEVCEHKPPAMLYLDDRGIPFTGDWEEAILAIRAVRR